MAESISARVAWKLRKAIAGKPARSASNVGTASFVRTDDDGVSWVRLPGADVDTPVNGNLVTDMKPGDIVSYRINGGRLSVMGNATSPSTSATYVQSVVEPVEDKADAAISDAARAYNAAENAEKSAEIANDAANQAIEDAATADSAARAAAANAAAAQSSANAAGTAAAQAISDAAAAQTSADAAGTAAASAIADAAAAQTSADNAAASATQANTSASSALVQLSVIEDVAGTLEWISQHGSYVASTDTTVVDGKIYFELDHGDYVPIANPDPSANPSSEGWYVLDVTDSQTEYIMAHLAVTNAGLWVLPSGIGDAPSERYANGYKLLLANDGLRVYDGNGQLVVTYGESIDFSSSRPQHIGGEYAYISYYDSNNDGVPDSIYIGGSNVTIGGKTLSEFEQAIGDATAARKYAEDVPIVTLSSTNGTVFKRNAGVSTTVIATIFTPGGRIDNATELHRRFGAGAYLEWGWRDVVTDASHVLVVTDPRIIMDGFGLVVSPDDIDTQAVITCSLNY